MTDTPNNGRAPSVSSEVEVNFVDDQNAPLQSSQKKEVQEPPPVEKNPSPKGSEEIQIIISDQQENKAQQKDLEKEVEIIVLDAEEDDEEQGSGDSQGSSSWDGSQDTLEFLEACKSGNLEIVETLLTKAPSMLQLMSSKIRGSYAIHVILQNAQDEVLKYLLEQKKHVGQWLHLHSIPCMSLALKTMLIPKLRVKALNCFLQLLDRFPDIVGERDRLGRTAFHWACIAGSEKAVQALLKTELKVNDDDLNDKQPVHYAIERGHAGVLALLLNQLGSELLVESDNKETLLERAIHCSSWKCLLTILSVGGIELLSIPNSKGELPAQASKIANNEHIFKRVIAEFEKSKDKNVEEIVASAVKSDKPTMLLTSNHCNMHRASEERFRGYPEKPERLESLYNSKNTGVLQGIDFSELAVKRAMPSVKIVDVLKVHEYSYVERLEQIVHSLKRRDELSEPGKPPSTYHLDSDTYMNQYTLNAAKVAAGSVVEAVEQVLEGKVKNAFVAVRPPGHHCGPFGAVSSPLQPEATSNGFCFFNNAAIGAAYVRSMRRAGISRVAIVDFDVHHGNGTQQIIEHLRPAKMKMKVDFPFTKGHLEYSTYKPWLDQEDSKHVLFISSHGFDDQAHDFYPMSGVECTSEEDPDYPGGILNLPYPKYASSAHFRDMYTRAVFPRLALFKPDFIILSSGFDAHEEDEVNDNFGQWNQHDYGWLTSQIIKIANTYCDGRVVSILEGGYCIKGGHLSPFAESVATHVRELARPNPGLYKPPSDQEMKSAAKEEEQRMLRKREMRVERRFSLRKRKTTETVQNPLEGREEQIEAEINGAAQEGKSNVEGPASGES